MSISAFDLFKIGIGPSSSHTVGPMIAARQFGARIESEGLLPQVARINAQLYGSLGLTGRGHGSLKAVILGLEGETPEHVEVETIHSRLADIRGNNVLRLMGKRDIEFVESRDLKLHRRKSLPFHPNGMKFSAFSSTDEELCSAVFYSVGGGFVVDENAAREDCLVEDETPQPYPFNSAVELLALCRQHDLAICDLMMENEKAWRTEDEIRRDLLGLWQVMQDCVARGCVQEGQLPGGLNVERRAAKLHRQLLGKPLAALTDPLTILDWVTLYALAVNEENAAGGRLVTAPTNGAAGIIPAVIHYYRNFCPGANDDGIVRFLLTAAAIGILYKKNASISGAEVGCQGEVGSACSMAAGALVEAQGGTPEQVENAAEIGMEHNLGLTCDPIGGLVQIPCIERNAMASIKAISAARMALNGDGTHFVSLDKVIKTMRDTGRDMKDKYKETARGGLALNVIEVPVNIVEC
ncbi:MAG: L-serine dehydratase [Halieaceae bacterium]|jgi:L-serine dehydratase